MPDRSIELEMHLMHLQKTLQELDEVIRAQSVRIDSLERDLKRLNVELGILRESSVEQPAPADERPPHY
jgi:SlyX protein